MSFPTGVTAPSVSDPSVTNDTTDAATVNRGGKSGQSLPVSASRKAAAGDGPAGWFGADTDVSGGNL
jgi:hypothetical protein